MYGDSHLNLERPFFESSYDYMVALSSQVLIEIIRESQAEPKNRIFENVDRCGEFVNRHELAGAMRDANVAGAKHDGLGAQRDHAGGFSAEGDCAGRLVCGLGEEFNQF